jgi:hypothetical protein
MQVVMPVQVRLSGASTGSTAGAACSVVFSTLSPSFGFVVSVTVSVSESSDAATSETRADRTAGSVTNATAFELSIQNFHGAIFLHFIIINGQFN